MTSFKDKNLGERHEAVMYRMRSLFSQASPGSVEVPIKDFIEMYSITELMGEKLFIGSTRG